MEEEFENFLKLGGTIITSGLLIALAEKLLGSKNKSKLKSLNAMLGG